MKQNKSSDSIKVRFTEEMIPKKILLKIKIVFFILGVIQNCFYFVILVSLNDLERVFESKSTVIVCLG